MVFEYSPHCVGLSFSQADQIVHRRDAENRDQKDKQRSLRPPCLCGNLPISQTQLYAGRVDRSTSKPSGSAIAYSPILHPSMSSCVMCPKTPAANSFGAASG